MLDQSEQNTEESEDELGAWSVCNVVTLCTLLCTLLIVAHQFAQRVMCSALQR